MTHTNDKSILLRTVSNLGESGVAVTVAAELEDVRLELNDVDIHIATFSRVHSSSRVDRILVLGDLRYSITVVWPVLISTEIVDVKEVGLARFSRHDSQSFDIGTSEYIRRE